MTTISADQADYIAYHFPMATRPINQVLYARPLTEGWMLKVETDSTRRVWVLIYGYETKITMLVTDVSRADDMLTFFGPSQQQISLDVVA